MFFVIVIIVITGILAALFMLSRVLAPDFNYTGCHVLITGGSSGIGLESAKGFE